MFSLFPDFNIYSTPLLVLVIQGVIFAVLLLQRYTAQKYFPDLLLGFILLITCYHRTTYTIGFMGWYDVFRNTKINYYLVPIGLGLAPLLYQYVRSITVSQFRWKRAAFYHFIPFAIFLFYRIFMFVYDACQPGFDETQNGIIMNDINNSLIDPIYTLISNVQMIIYLSFTFQFFFQYRKKITQYYSNTYNLQLNWLRNFLFIYTFLFLYSLGQIFVDLIITDLHWTQMWWYHFFSGLAILYIGIKGYSTKTDSLTDLEFNTVNIINTDPIERTPSNEFDTDKTKIAAYFDTEKPFLNSELTLKILSKELGYSTNQLSEIINKGFQLNFNDFVNNYRVEAVKKALQAGAHKEKSLVGIALDCGFNSKPTFNRVFKKLSNLSPTQYVNNLN